VISAASAIENEDNDTRFVNTQAIVNSELSTNVVLVRFCTAFDRVFMHATD
jgi:hypothetical protein